MTEIQNFRSSFRGFHREDVVAYIAFLNNRHSAQLEQLNAQLQAALAKTQDPELLARLEAAEARCIQLEEALSQAQATPSSVSNQELETYRRAERAERMAQERAQQIYQQANATLADATAKAESAAAVIGSVADQVNDQLRQYQQTVLDTKATFQDAVAALYTISAEE